MGQKHYSKRAKRKAKKAVGGIPGLTPVQRRQPNGQKHRPVADRGGDSLALKARCRQRGVAETSANIRDSRAPWWGCEAGRAMAGAVEAHDERVRLWDAIQHMRRVVAAYDAAIGAPRRHAKCLRLLVPQSALEATADTPPLDIRTTEDRHRQAVAAYMRLEGWLAHVDRAAMAETKRVVWDDVAARDARGLIAALECVADGVAGRKLAYRARA